MKSAPSGIEKPISSSTSGTPVRDNVKPGKCTNGEHKSRTVQKLRRTMLIFFPIAQCSRPVLLNQGTSPCHCGLFTWTASWKVRYTYNVSMKWSTNDSLIRCQLARGNTSTTLSCPAAIVEWLLYVTLQTRKNLQTPGMWWSMVHEMKYGGSSKSNALRLGRIKDHGGRGGAGRVAPLMKFRSDVWVGAEIA